MGQQVATTSTRMQALLATPVESLANSVYDEWVAGVADFREGGRPNDWLNPDSGKRIPYVGWFWRQPDWSGNDISIGDCGDFIGVMENNKWDYPERRMTEAEVDTFMDFLDRAHDAESKGGNLDDLFAARDAILADCWRWMQTLRDTGGWREWDR